jgi:hypothetical protein
MKKSFIILTAIVMAMAYFANGAIDGLAEQSQKDELRLCIDSVIDNFGYGAVKVKYWNRKGKVLEIWISEKLAGGTDGQCEASAILFHKLCSLDSKLLLHVTSDNGWVPSRVNPMTLKWTQKLIQAGLY